ncbi:Ldh family oxidoreductase [Streptomyces sp. NPDC058424]|uniref:Ldh family oxidoreductase n=1 Tax=Streptomyces sp. NPDC058424 TaxID=3346491 RepID=UPI00364E08E7
MSLGVGTAQALAAGLLEAAGLARERAERTAEAIVLADVWGVGSHGLLRLPYYLQRMVAGGYPPDAELVPVSDTGPVVAYDGGGGLGHWQLHLAAKIAAERCRQFGVAAVSVGNSGHCGALGAYVLPPLRDGLVSLVFSQGPAVMPAWGGSEPLLSTSPLAAGIPTRPRPVIVDLATSAVARGKIAAAAQRGEQLPQGWALDADGRPTTDPQKALHGLLAPLGGAKGFVLALLVESLTGGLVGPLLSADVPDMFRPEEAAQPQRVAHLVLALDPAVLDASGGDGAQERLDDLARRVVASGGRTPGTGRLFPEEVDQEARLDLPAALEEELRSWARKYGIEASL